MSVLIGQCVILSNRACVYVCFKLHVWTVDFESIVRGREKRAFKLCLVRIFSKYRNFYSVSIVVKNFKGQRREYDIQVPLFSKLPTGYQVILNPVLLKY